MAEHRRLSRRVSHDLGTSAAALVPTDERIGAYATGVDPALAALYFQFGRYLLISSSRPGTQPANLQGIWNDRMDPPWGAKYTININTEMNYWPAETTNLAECVVRWCAWCVSWQEMGARTAKVQYGARGWVAHHNTNLWRESAAVDGAQWGMWPTGGAWLALHLWEHYLFGSDQKYLAEGDLSPLVGSALRDARRRQDEPARRHWTHPQRTARPPRPFDLSLDGYRNGARVRLKV